MIVPPFILCQLSPYYNFELFIMNMLIDFDDVDTKEESKTKKQETTKSQINIPQQPQQLSEKPKSENKVIAAIQNP